jgi:hypothetical protein
MQERKMQEIKLVESGVTLDLNLERQGSPSKPTP